MCILPRFERAQFNVLLDQYSTSPSTLRTLPDLIRHNALHNPLHLFCLQCKQSATEEGSPLAFVHVTFAQLKETVDRCCRWLETVADIQAASLGSGGSVQKIRPVALFMESDLGLFVHIAALLTLNVPCVLLSVRLSSAAVRHLLNQTDANTVVTSLRTSSVIEDALSEKHDPLGFRVNVKIAVSFEQHLTSAIRAPSYETTHKQTVRENDTNVLILHSSGTTGLPKAIPLAHRYLLGYGACHSFPPEEDMSNQGLNLSTLPLFHGFGALAPCLALSVGKPVCFPPSSTIANCNLVVSIIRARDVTSLMTVPSILEDFTLLDDFAAAVEVLARLKFVACGGGGLKTSVGMALESQRVTLLNHFGATELGALAPIFQPGSDYDWRYLRIRSDLGLKLEILDQDRRSCKLVGYPFGRDCQFELQDRLEMNPLNESEVRILGRNDDVLVLATGEKVLPHNLEQCMEQHPSIRRAIAFGNGQPELGVLIEPIDQCVSSEGFIETIWPSIIAANDFMDSHACISTKSAILIKPAGKGIPLSDKGSPQRNEVYRVFESEITSVYAKLEGSQTSAEVAPFDFEHVEDSLRVLVRSCLPGFGRSQSSNDYEDFVNLGMDSLKATKLRRMLNASLRKSSHIFYSSRNLPSDFVYAHPSLSSLATALKDPGHGILTAEGTAKVMRTFVSKYAMFNVASPPKRKNCVVLLTGTTGNLGAHLLAQIARLDSVTRVICMLRSETSSLPGQAPTSLETRQHDAFKDRGIQLPKEAWSKIQLLQWHIGEDFFGLGHDAIQELAAQITHIFHGAWPMDFNMKVASFEPQIKVVKDLLELARSAHRKRSCLRPRLVLASSIAVVGCYSKIASSGAVVPESPMKNPSATLPIGYAQAKWCCEKVIESARDSIPHEVEASIFRIGQLSGSQSTGFWSSREHFPALVKACQDVKAVPDLRGTLSWLPVDRAARVTMELLISPDLTEPVYHIENPIRQPWSDLCTIIETNLSIPAKRRLPFQEWLDQVSAHGDGVPDLLEFLREHFLHMSSGSLVLETSKSLAISPTLRSSGSVRFDTIELYLEFWRRQGFLS